MSAIDHFWAVSIFADVLARQLRADSSRPLITFYDDATGERVELSVTTYANWVAKAASLPGPGCHPTPSTVTKGSRIALFSSAPAARFRRSRYRGMSDTSTIKTPATAK